MFLEIVSQIKLLCIFYELNIPFGAKPKRKYLWEEMFFTSGRQPRYKLRNPNLPTLVKRSGNMNCLSHCSSMKGSTNCLSH